MTQSLTERLDYEKDKKLVIVNCDDLGSSHSANLAIDDAMSSGFATSATLMVPCPWAHEAARMFAGRDIGAHLTLTAEYPGYRWRALTAARSLHDADGFLPLTATEVWAKADLRDVEAECRAQIEQALSWRVDVTHLDSHMGTMQIRAEFYAIYLKLASEYRLPLRMANASSETQLGFPARQMAYDAGVLFNDHFVLQWSQLTRNVLLDVIPKLRAGVTEICVHPVKDGPELEGYDRTQAHVRTHDYACVMDHNLSRMFEDAGAKFISFRALRDAMREPSKNYAVS
ncbi:MAG: ChbG/HpnK family deacetylase [Proteobacteria bacterium]|nr:ChbG/HpnK family deacetylase [Pseudomonadota bacterium]